MQEPIFWREGCWILKFEKKRKIQILCIAAGAFFFLIYPMAGASDFLKPGGVIERNTYGQGDKEGILMEKKKLKFRLKNGSTAKKKLITSLDRHFRKHNKKLWQIIPLLTK